MCVDSLLSQLGKDHLNVHQECPPWGHHHMHKLPIPEMLRLLFCANLLYTLACLRCGGGWSPLNVAIHKQYGRGYSLYLTRLGEGEGVVWGSRGTSI